tara:strand:- start:99 stop:719 length:621 start_codon:yes stop_codon:yes gene_type:complete
MTSKSQLAIKLSKLKVFENPKVRLEQYPTDSEIAADILWNMHMNNEIKDKVIVDAGCGTGILGIGCLLLGAKRVIFIEIDENAVEILHENLKSEGLTDLNSYKIIIDDIKNIDFKADITIQNPPFGVQNKHADKIFLEKAIKNSKIAYSMHKSETKGFVEAVCKENNAKITQEFKFSFPLKQVYKHHKKRIERINVSCFRITQKPF